ncbi:ATP-binding cassette domain-containing protein [Roseibium aggregatum]|uniref:ATP-binding cassette domain-containing protein n=1 Tax=Roseibium aggregatum TaxID=187304 RepID=A0A939J2B5_9HYPH|nr:ATP-binding cassette domain-containing protein [Roseibium aggregatum]MBN9668910.1 ATP-binding cassette domain-containing protein [Roseibium aggregatum]
MMLFEAAHVTLRFDGAAQPVLHDFSWSLGKGESWWVSGASGCGKTTLLRLIAGLLAPTGGRVERHARRVGVAFSDIRLVPHLDLVANLALVRPDLRRNPALQQRLEEDLLFLGLDAVRHLPARDLSKGQQQRAALLRALVIVPDLLLLDEAASGLDDDNWRNARELVRRYREKDPFALVEVSHNPQRLLGKSGVCNCLPLSSAPEASSGEHVSAGP